MPSFHAYTDNTNSWRNNAIQQSTDILPFLRRIWFWQRSGVSFLQLHGRCRDRPVCKKSLYWNCSDALVSGIEIVGSHWITLSLLNLRIRSVRALANLSFLEWYFRRVKNYSQCAGFLWAHSSNKVSTTTRARAMDAPRDARIARGHGPPRLPCR